MSKLLMNLRNVPDDELADVRAMLDEHRIAYYETKPSRWGISFGGVWVAEASDFAEAKRLMAVYQAGRQQRARDEYDAARRAGTAETFWTVLRQDPARVALTVLGILFMLALLALPVFLLRR